MDYSSYTVFLERAKIMICNARVMNLHVSVGTYLKELNSFLCFCVPNVKNIFIKSLLEKCRRP